MEAIFAVLALMVLLAVPILIAILVIWVKRKMQTLLVRMAEERMLRHPWTVEARIEKAGSIVYFPYSTAGSLLLILCWSAFSWLLSDIFAAMAKLMPARDYWDLSMVSSLAQIPALLMVPVVLYLHYSGIGGRKIKYELLLGSALGAWFSGAFIFALIKTWAGSWQPAISIGTGIGLLFWWFLFCVAQALVPRLLVRRREAPVMRKWFYNFQSPVWWTLAWLLLPLFVLYCLVRFYIVDIISRQPILYFRPFSLRDGSISFSKIVAKAARRYGIIEGLVTYSQRNSELQASLTLNEQAHFMTADDASWKNWVAGKLAIASVAIIDMTGASNNVNWEVFQAVSSLGTSRVAILYNGARPAIPEGVWELGYGLGRQEIKKARLELSSWLRRELFVTSKGTRMEVSAQDGPPYASAKVGA